MNFNDFVKLSDLVTEVTAEEKFNRQYVNKLERSDFDKAVALDPTTKDANKVGKYVDWIIKNQLFGMKPDQLENIKATIAKFDKFKDKLDPTQRDINKFKYDDLEKIITDTEATGALVSKKEKVDERKTKAEKESEVVFQNATYIVIVPNTMYASQYFGAGADWCTARQDDNRCMYKNYANSGTLYIILNKKTKDKWQLYKGESVRDKQEMKNARNQNFNPFEEFNDDDEMIKWLRKEEFNEDTGELTADQIEELATSFIRGLGISTADKEYDDALSTAKYVVRQENESNLEAYTDEAISNDDMYRMINDKIGEWQWNIEEGLKELENYMGVKHDSPHNINLLIPYAYEEIYDDVERFIKGQSGDIEYDDTEKFNWEYTYDSDIEDIFDRFNKREMFDNLDYIKHWLEWNYKNDFDRFRDFYDDFIKLAEDNKFDLDDHDKQTIKDLIDTVEKTEYSKAGHPKLDLQSIDYKEYLNNKISKNI